MDKRTCDNAALIVEKLEYCGIQSTQSPIIRFSFAPYKEDVKFLEHMCYYTMVIGVFLNKNGWEMLDLLVKDDDTHFALVVRNKYYDETED